MNAAAIGVALAVVAATAISVTNVASRLHFEAGSNPSTFLLWRYLLFLAALIVLVKWNGRALWPDARRRDLFMAGLLNVIGAGSLAFAIERIPVALAVTILYLFPCMTVLTDAWLARRWPNRLVLLAVVLALIGLAMALGLGSAGTGAVDLLGLVFAFVAAAGIASSLMWSERRLGMLDELPRLYGLTVTGTVAVIVLSGVSADVVWPFTTLERGLTLVAAALGFMIATSAVFAAVARVGAARTSILMNLEPPVTVLLAWLLLDERLATMQLLGIAIVLAAVLMSQFASVERGIAAIGARPESDQGVP